ncbi:DUF389 domain-containing protein [bacterium]|nr:DUF389 domain-containing protein [bacterium]
MDFTEPTQPEEENLSKARRRRARRKVISPLTPDERTSYVQEVMRKASPSFDFFLFSLFSGAVVGLGFILDSPAVILLGILLAPLMAPVVGISLGIILGSTPYFLRNLGGFLIGGLLVTVGSALAGVATHLWDPWQLTQVHLFTQITWPPFLVIAIGAIATSATLVKENQHPGIPSIAMAFGIFIPLAAAGFGLGSGIEHLWPDGLVLFSIHLAWASLVGAVSLAVMGFRPLSIFGYSIGGVVLLAAVILLVGFFGFGTIFSTGVALPTPTPSLTPSLTPTLTTTPTPVPPTATNTPTITPTSTITPTQTFTPSPTPVEAKVNNASGVLMRKEPSLAADIVSWILDENLVLLTGASQTDEYGQVWLQAIDLSSSSLAEGWIQARLVVTATPGTVEPTDAPTLTPTLTLTPTTEPSLTPTP